VQAGGPARCISLGRDGAREARPPAPRPGRDRRGARVDRDRGRRQRSDAGRRNAARRRGSGADPADAFAPADPDAFADALADPDADAFADALADPDADPFADAFAPAGADAHAFADADASAGAVPDGRGRPVTQRRSRTRLRSAIVAVRARRRLS
jgi:hypothetical protein